MFARCYCFNWLVVSPGLLPVGAACPAPALPVLVPGDGHVLIILGQQGVVSLGRPGADAACVQRPPGEGAPLRHVRG